MNSQALVRSLDDLEFGRGLTGRGLSALWRGTWSAAGKTLPRGARNESLQQRPLEADSSVASSVLEPTMETGVDDFTSPISDDVQPTVIGLGRTPEPPATPSDLTDDREPLRGYCESILYSLRQSAGDGGKMPHVIGVTSCYAGEGVTTLASQLALAAAAGGRRVLLADVNLDSPGLHRVFRTDLSPGLVDACDGDPTLERVTRTLPGSGLSFVPAGQVRHAAQASYLERVRELVRFAADHYDFAVCDLPPLDRPSETLPVCGLLDGVLLLVEAERVRWPVAERLVGSLTRSGAKPLGVVMNKQKRHVPQWLYRTL